MFGIISNTFNQAELPGLRHQLLMLEGERRKDIVLDDLKVLCPNQIFIVYKIPSE